MKNGYKKKTLKLTRLGLLIALIVVLQALSTLLSRAAVLPFNLTLTLVPIIVGALTIDIAGGAILGFAFGIIVMIFGFTGYDPSCAVLIESNVFFFILLCLVKGTAAGAGAGVVGRLLKDHKYAAAFTAAAVAPILNTGLFLVGMRVFYYDLMVDWAASAGQSIIYYAIIGLCGWNFVIELGLNLILAPAVVRIADIVKRR